MDFYNHVKADLLIHLKRSYSLILKRSYSLILKRTYSLMLKRTYSFILKLTYSFILKLTHYGCCSDGKTAADDFNGKGCPAEKLTCDVTAFGCCPDGLTPAPNKEKIGCPPLCQSSEHGCCPDLKTPASGKEFIQTLLYTVKRLNLHTINFLIFMAHPKGLNKIGDANKRSSKLKKIVFKFVVSSSFNRIYTIRVYIIFDI